MCIRDSINAEYMGMEEVKEVNPYGCGICFKSPVEPVVAVCGHLFCWPCVYKRMATSKMCPQCESDLDEDSFVPVYVRDSRGEDLSPSLPKRPEAKRAPATANPNYRGIGGNPSVEIGKFVMGYGLFPSAFVLNFTQGRIVNEVPGVQGVNQENPEEKQDKVMRVLLVVLLVLAFALMLFMQINSAV
eukprot:TRINITY_DN2977_c0_g1_i1.p1 TRINITY_DN2977_c0_g1~~TRINITY_DN2977_c0_g1_i1.p1  ORF type:complete len:202 (+),score=36.41 TRINITY_DN2977_c0_g1_i1:48-608(+)